MTSLTDDTLSLVDFLPDSIASDPEIVALSLAIDPELRAVGQAIIEATILPRIADLEDDVLDELAWAFQLDTLRIWDDATTAQKRTLLSNIFAIRKKSGTRFAVRRAFDLVSVEGVVVEWWEEGATPNTFRTRITADDTGLTLDQIMAIFELVTRFQRTSQKLSEFAAERDESAPLELYPAPLTGRLVTISYGGP